MVRFCVLILIIVTFIFYARLNKYRNLVIYIIRSITSLWKLFSLLSALFGPIAICNFNNCDAKPANVIIVVVQLISNMRYYNILFRFFDKDCIADIQKTSKKKSRSKLRWNLPPKNWIRINVDASKSVL